ncbi:hypothetical protein AB1Y20_018089 [Prymnesium parvum]|uniref:Fibronectin type-II domain-containing protein n=1 Tax=Prymnesium parvum TaxID=97485 RepID=A0AB34JR36_PRYPA
MPSRSQSSVLTQSGCECDFPFEFKGTTYTSCTLEASKKHTGSKSQPWCAVKDTADGCGTQEHGMRYDACLPAPLPPASPARHRHAAPPAHFLPVPFDDMTGRTPPIPPAFPYPPSPPPHCRSPHAPRHAEPPPLAEPPSSPRRRHKHKQPSPPTPPSSPEHAKHSKHSKRKHKQAAPPTPPRPTPPLMPPYPPLPPTSPPSSSFMSCDQLGWPHIRHAAGLSCFYTVPNGQQCMALAGWSSAATQCAHLGARLCSDAEMSSVQASVRDHAACPLLLGRLAWTSRSCVASLIPTPGELLSFIGYYAAPVASGAIAQMQCVPTRTPLAVLCCADARPPSPPSAGHAASAPSPSPRAESNAATPAAAAAAAAAVASHHAPPPPPPPAGGSGGSVASVVGLLLLLCCCCFLCCLHIRRVNSRLLREQQRTGKAAAAEGGRRRGRRPRGVKHHKLRGEAEGEAIELGAPADREAADDADDADDADADADGAGEMAWDLDENSGGRVSRM